MKNETLKNRGITAKQLRKMLLEEGYTYEKVARKIGCSKQRVGEYRKELGFDLKNREPKWYALWRNCPQLETPEKILQYQGKGLKIISEELKVPLHFLKAQIKRFGLDPELFHYRAPRKLVTCAYCGKSIEKYLCHLRSEQRYFFCNREHFRAWQKEHWGEVLNEAKKGKEVILEMRANTLKKRRVDTKWLGEKILEDGWTYARVAEELKCSKQQVKKYCDTFGIKKSQRTARWYARKRGIPQLETPDWLLEQLKNGKRGITTLAKELRVSYSFLKHQIIRLGLDPKTFCYFQPQRIETTCAYCGKPITRASYKIFRKNYRYRHSFCNREHFQLWWAQNRERILKKKQT